MKFFSMAVVQLYCWLEKTVIWGWLKGHRKESLNHTFAKKICEQLL